MTFKGHELIKTLKAEEDVNYTGYLQDISWVPSESLEVEMYLQLQEDGRCMYVIPGKNPIIYISHIPVSLVNQNKFHVFNRWEEISLEEFNEVYFDTFLLFSKFNEC